MGRHSRKDNEHGPRQERSGWKRAARAARLLGKIALGQVVSWVAHEWWTG